LPVLKCAFNQIFIIFQVYTHSPIENLGSIERVGKVAIIKQQCKNCRQETICSKMLIFLVQNALKLTYERLLIEKVFRLVIARHDRRTEEDPHDFYNRLTPLVEIQLFLN
jgi:ribosomal protein S3AE